MSVDFSSERVCYVHCSFCTTILAVSVPYASLFTLVTVRCGHCTNLLSLNIGVSLHQTSAPPIHQDLQPHRQHTTSLVTRKDCASSSRSTNNLSENIDREAPRMPPIRPPEKRQRVPSAYNRFIKEEIQRIKACNPEISHREAFSTAAKNVSFLLYHSFSQGRLSARDSSKKKKILIVASSTMSELYRIRKKMQKKNN
ncbi:YABBY protein [Arabidopsis thaliana x Arabidopsis arenosa]|uniref:YAB2 n=2 Tax=Arabidopsis TaxID=3701 RepID=A0A178WCI8_ARATH|nr:YABBY protein [Arabidopsis thaliana x Arabidopsis arenosa]OAP15804.1 YAB2 [Arabidopsis thaliana]